MTHIYSQFGYTLTECYLNWSKDMEYKIITINRYCQPYHIEYNQFRIETLTVFEIEIPETIYV